MKTIVPSLMALALMAAVGCNGQRDINDSGTIPTEHQEIRGDCLSMMAVMIDSGYLELDVVDDDLYIYHRNAYYSCCLDYRVDYEIDGLNILATESDLAEPCRCDCFFNLQSTLYDLTYGNYTVCLVGISGDTIGIDSIFVNPIHTR